MVDKKLLVRYVIRESMGLMVMGAALFWPTGRLDWWQAWAALGIMLIWTVATAVIILRRSPELLAERLGPRQGSKSWDMLIMSILGINQLMRYIIAGLDQRYGWSAGLSLPAQIIALLICSAGYFLVIWATASNAYFSQIVRLQSERGQTVAAGGPYRFVRHPAYLGVILYELAVPILLSSWWALIPSGLNLILIILRTVLEDRTLQAELVGYADYAAKVRYRLLTGNLVKIQSRSYGRLRKIHSIK